MAVCWCGRGSRGFGFKHKTEVYKFCSMKHQNEFIHNFKQGKQLKPLTDIENKAIETSMNVVKEFLDEKQTYDLRELSFDDRRHMFKLFYGTVCNNLSLDNDIPF